MSTNVQLFEKEMVFAKLDIKDGFLRMVVSNEDARNFCYILPSEDPTQTLDDTQIVIPNSLQMRWCESPPFFCAASETARDVITSLIDGTPPLTRLSLSSKLASNAATPPPSSEHWHTVAANVQSISTAARNIHRRKIE
jgi:hypothetical protein